MAKQKKTLNEVELAFYGCGLDASKLELMPVPGENPEQPKSYFVMYTETGEILQQNMAGTRLLDYLAGVAFAFNGVLPLLDLDVTVIPHDAREESVIAKPKPKGRQKRTRREVEYVFASCVDMEKRALKAVPDPKDPEHPASFFVMDLEKKAIIMANLTGNRLMDILAGVQAVRQGKIPMVQSEDSEKDSEPISAVG